jgi:YaiO family outer membrane protein
MDHSEASGASKGWILSGDWYHDDRGPWSFSVVGTQRPEGKGTQFALGKELTFGENSSVSAGMGTGTGADFVPRFRADLGLNLGITGPWSLALGAGWNRFGDSTSTTLLQAGPGWAGDVWSASAQVQQRRYLPGKESDTGFLLDLRWGAHNLRRWHAVRAAWGHGVIDYLQPGGTGSSTLPGSGGVWSHGRGNQGALANPATTATDQAPSEFLLNTTSYVPLTKHMALRADLGWARRGTQAGFWTGTLQAAFTF